MDDYDKQDKQKIGKGDEVRATKPKKDKYGEWNAKIFVNGKNYKPAEIFADSEEDAKQQVRDAIEGYRKKGATIYGEKKKDEDDFDDEETDDDEEIEESTLREEIRKLSGLI